MLPGRQLRSVAGAAPQSLSLTRRLSAARQAKGQLDYKAAGVDIDAGNELVKRIKKLNPDIGGFSGLYPLGESHSYSQVYTAAMQPACSISLNVFMIMLSMCCSSEVVHSVVTSLEFCQELICSNRQAHLEPACFIPLVKVVASTSCL